MSSNSAAVAVPRAKALPAHVPAELAFDLPFFARTSIDENPHETLIPEMHASLPPLTYVTNIFPGKRPGWLLKNAADVKALLLDSENFIKKGMGQWSQDIGENWLVIPTEADPPYHAIYRKTLNPSFAPMKMVALTGKIRERAKTLIAGFKDRGSCDFVNEFSEKFPINIVLDLLGLPQERMQQFLVWEKEMLHTDDLTIRRNATRAVKNYLLEEIDNRRRSPQDDYITQVINYEVDGKKWSEDEVLGHCFNLYLGGLDTVTSLLGLMFNFLASHPEHQRQLRETPNLNVFAVEELLRAFGPVTSFRICSKEVEIHGQKIMPGEYVAVSTPMAGRDPAYYENPQVIDFNRKPTILSLGGGIHKCLGQHLARLELQIAVQEFVTAIPEFRVEDGFKVRYFVGNIVHVPALQLQWK
jgi:cytochrome P450